MATNDNFWWETRLTWPDGWELVDKSNDGTIRQVYRKKYDNEKDALTQCEFLNIVRAAGWECVA